MKLRTNTIIKLMIAAVLCCAFTELYVEHSYYAMGGQVDIVDKTQTNRGYTITIEQPAGDSTAQFKLRCSEAQYNRVEIGDVAECDRVQSALTHSGVLHDIPRKYIDSEWVKVDE